MFAALLVNNLKHPHSRTLLIQWDETCFTREKDTLRGSFDRPGLARDIQDEMFSLFLTASAGMLPSQPNNG